jgi:hypothetical protein
VDYWISIVVTLIAGSVTVIELPLTAIVPDATGAIVLCPCAVLAVI